MTLSTIITNIPTALYIQNLMKKVLKWILSQFERSKWNGVEYGTKKYYKHVAFGCPDLFLTLLVYVFPGNSLKGFQCCVMWCQLSWYGQYEQHNTDLWSLSKIFCFQFPKNIFIPSLGRHKHQSYFVQILCRIFA